MPALVEALKTETDDDFGEVVRALGKIGPEAKAAVPSLLRRLEDRNDSHRADVAFALACVSPRHRPKAVAVLAEVMGGESIARLNAAAMLARISEPHREEALTVLREGLKHDCFFAAAENINRWLAEGKLHPLIGRTFPLLLHTHRNLFSTAAVHPRRQRRHRWKRPGPRESP